jgi:hypothetical protein
VRKLINERENVMGKKKERKVIFWNESGGKNKNKV